MKALFWFVLAVLMLVAPRELGAQAEPSVSASIEPSDIEIGDSFVVSLRVTTDASAPSASDPRLPLPDGLRAGPPSISTQTQISLMNGRLTRSSGMTATWQVVATREGVFNVGPPSVAWNGKRLQSSHLRITVHGAGVLGGRGRGRRGAPTPNPFDPFGMFPKLPGFFDTPDPEPPPVEAPQDPELSIEAPLDSKVFLRSVVDQKTPVVGEQVTLTVYIYARGGTIELTDVHEPSIPDFFRRDMMSPNTQPDARVVSINGVPWRVQPIFKVALFPLRAGDLTIGPMQATINGRTSGLVGAVRTSQAIKVHSTEPPASGRPVGYQVGDVGFYSISATVDPRTTEVGGAVAVTIILGGVGNVPSAIKIPASSSVEWLEPQMRENIEVENGKVRGSRTFSYVVRPKVAGNIDLGAVTLPYWSPDRKVYETARASLGKVQVAPDKAMASAKEPDVPHDPWSSVGAPRDKLGSYPRARQPFTDEPFYWLGLFGAPLSVVIGSLGTKGIRRLRARWAARRDSPERGIERALAQARDAKGSGDRAGVAASLDRAIHLAIERATGLKARALLLHEIPAALEGRKVPADVATETKNLLASIEELRFVPEAGSLAGDMRVESRDGDLIGKVAGLVRKLSRVAVVFVLFALFAGNAAAAPDETMESLFHKGVAALREGALNDAVEVFEAMADRGFVHPDVSFDRSLSYLGRVRAGVERPGDLGRAAAALEETLRFRPEDREAESALELVRAEVARRRARSGSSAEVESRPTLERAMLGIVSEWTWLILATFSSLLLTAGLVLRFVALPNGGSESETLAPDTPRENALQLASAIAIPIGSICLVAFAVCAAGSRHLRLTTREGVVVAPEAHLVSDKGVLTNRGPIPEAARVEVGDQRGALVHVRWGSIEGWTQSDAVRRLAQP